MRFSDMIVAGERDHDAAGFGCGYDARAASEPDLFEPSTGHPQKWHDRRRAELRSRGAMLRCDREFVFFHRNATSSPARAPQHGASTFATSGHVSATRKPGITRDNSSACALATSSSSRVSTSLTVVLRSSAKYCRMAVWYR